jgi:tetratricopeptide (TPR) repeat protein
LNEFKTARVLLERSLRLRRRIPDAERQVADSLTNLALAYLRLEDLDRAEELLEEALEIQDRVGLSGANFDTLAMVASTLEKKEDFVAAEPLYRQILAGKEERFGAESEEYANTLNNLGNNLLGQGRYEEAIDPLRQALLIRRRELGADHQKVATTLVNLAYALDQTGESADALPLIQEALTLRRNVHGGDSARFASTENVLGYILLGIGNEESLARAETSLRHAETVLLQRNGGDDSNTVVTQRHLAATLLAQRRPGEALSVVEKALAANPTGWPEDSWRWADLRSLHGAILAELGRYEEAEPLIVNAIPKIEATLGEDSRYAREARARRERLLELRAGG